MLDETDCWKKGVTLDAVEIEVVGGTVRSDEEDDSEGGREESFDESAEDHCISDVSYLELVEAQDVCVFCERGGDFWGGVVVDSMGCV